MQEVYSEPDPKLIQVGVLSLTPMGFASDLLWEAGSKTLIQIHTKKTIAGGTVGYALEWSESGRDLEIDIWN